MLSGSSNDGAGLSLVGHEAYLPLELGEMAMTLLDMFSLTGIPLGGVSIQIGVPLRLNPEGQFGALGWILERRGSGDTIPWAILMTSLATERVKVIEVGGHMTRQVARQYARVFLLLVFHDLFEAQGGDTTHLWWLLYIRDFSALYNFDWGSFILVVLYDVMDQVSRYMALNVKGFSLLWEVRIFAFFVVHFGSYSSILC